MGGTARLEFRHVEKSFPARNRQTERVIAVHEFTRLYTRENLWMHSGLTLAEVAVGFPLGSLLGIITGYVLGLSQTIEFILSPYILMLQIAPKVAFAPLFIIWFGFTVY